MLIFSNCENYDANLDSNNQTNFINKVKLTDATIQIESKSALKSIIKSYQNSIEGQNYFNNKIKNLQSEGFKPLTPIFDVNEIEKVQEFIIKKKAKLDKKTSNTSKIASEEISFEDEIIPDPSLAALLNEDREIIISDSLYKYTENGMYFCLMKDKQKLYDYLNKVGLSGKLSKNTSTNSQLTSKMALPAVTEVSDGINLFIPIDYYDVVPLVFATNSTVTSGIQTPKLIKQNLGICSIQKQGFFEKIFGASEKDEDYYDDNRRIQISYWNHNYFLFSSIGCSARLQKREKFLGVMYWDKSYADKIELGVNSVQYDYKFNVPQFNQSQYEYNTVFF